MSRDDDNRSARLNWAARGEPVVDLDEMIQVFADRKRRARTSQWFRDDKCRQGTLIDEVFVTRPRTSQG